MQAVYEPRLLAEQSEHALARGDAGTALALALEGLGKEPASVEAERAVHLALGSLRERKILDGHTHRVSAAVFTADSSKVVTGDHNGVLRVWDALTGARLARIETETSQMADMALSPDGARVATAPGYGGGPKLVDLVSGEVLAELKSFDASVSQIIFNQDGTRIVTAGYARPIEVWHGETGALLFAFEKHMESGKVHMGALVQEQGGPRVASGDAAGQIWIWDIDTPSAAVLLEGHEGDVRDLAFSPDGTQLVSMARDKTVRLWDTKTGDELLQWSGDFSSVSFSPDGRTILIGGMPESPDGATLVDAKSGAVLMRFFGPQERMYDAGFSADGQHIVARTQKLAVIWNVSSGRLVAQLDGHTAGKDEQLRTVSFSPDGSKVLTTGSYENERVAPEAATARIWDVDPESPLRAALSFVPPDDARNTRRVSISRSVMSADGAFAAFWSSFGEVAWLWDLRSGSSRVLENGQGRINSLVFSADGTQLLMGDDNGELSLRDTATGAVLEQWQDDESYRGRVALFAPDGTPLALSIDEDVLSLLDLRTGEQWLEVQDDFIIDYEYDSFAFSPDGRWLLGSGEDSYSFLVDVANARFIASEINGKVDGQGGLAFSPDGTLLLTADDGQVTLTRTESGEAQAEAGWFSPYSHFSSVTFNPADNLIATAGPDNAVWIRHAEDATVAQLIRAFGGMTSAYFNPAGDLLVLTARRRPVHVLARNPFDEGRWREITSLELPASGHSHQAVFTPDGAHILVWSSTEARLFSAPERGAALLTNARTQAPRCLSTQERRRYFLDPAPPRWCITGAGLEDETDAEKWQPVTPYRTTEWRRWQIAQDAGEAPDLPVPPTEN